MNMKTIFAAMLLAVFSLSVAYAAGGGFNEEFTDLLALSQKAVATGKQGNADAFLQDVEAALNQAKTQNDLHNSVSLDRIISRLKSAKAAGMAGNLPEGTAKVEEAISYMGKKPPPKFGGGSE
jgi:ABC-type lipoprotein release transport system permease subunit